MRGNVVKDKQRRRVVWERVPVSEAAAFLGVSIRTIDRMVARGELTAYRTSGGHRRFSAGDLHKLRRKTNAVKPRQAPTPKGNGSA